MEEKPTPFEKLLDDLEKKVAKMDSGELSLEEMIQSYESGAKLVKKCRSLLSGLEKKIEILASDNGEEEIWASFDPETGSRNKPEESSQAEKTGNTGESLPF